MKSFAHSLNLDFYRPFICFCPNRYKHWLELSFKVNRSSMRPFQRALVRFIIFEAIRFLESLMSINILKHLVHNSKWRVELNTWVIIFFFVPEEILYCFFNFLSDKLWSSVYLTYVQKFE